jgi:hypothetical protein
MRPKSGSCFSAECGLLDLLPLASRDQQYQAPHWVVSHRYWCWQGDRWNMFHPIMANNAGDDPYVLTASQMLMLAKVTDEASAKPHSGWCLLETTMFLQLHRCWCWQSDRWSKYQTTQWLMFAGNNYALTASQMLNIDVGRLTEKQSSSQILHDCSILLETTELFQLQRCWCWQTNR